MNTNLTYTEKFNSYLGTFINELVITFPEIKESVNKNYKEILEQNNNIVKTDKYVKNYMNIIKPLSKDISRIYDTGNERRCDIHMAIYLQDAQKILSTIWVRDW